MTTNPPEIPTKLSRPTSDAAETTSDAATAPTEATETTADTAASSSSAGGKPVLDPDQLSLERDDVAPLGENRYLVRAERDVESDRESADAQTENRPDTETEPEESQGPNYARVLAAAPEPHGVDLTLKTDGEIAHHRVMSNDVREVFVEMLTWYAAQLDDDLSPGEALQVMLAATDLEVGID